MTEDDTPGGAGVALQRVLTLRYLVVFGLAYLAPTVVFNYYGIKNVGSRGDLFEKVRSHGATSEVFGEAPAAPPGPPHLLPIRVAAADLDNGYLLDGLASFAQINATPCLVVEYTTRAATAELVAAVAKRLRSTDIAIWLMYRGLSDRAGVDQVIAGAHDRHALDIQAIVIT